MENIFEYEIIESNTTDKFDYKFSFRDDDKKFSYIEIQGFKKGKFVENLIIPSQLDGYNVRSIAQSAFANTKIKSLTLPSSIVHIYWAAFQNCNLLEEVRSITTNLVRPRTFKNEKEWVKEYYSRNNGISEIFKDCIKLRKVDFSKTHLYTIDYNSFENTAIEEIIFTENNYFDSVIGSRWSSWDLPTLKKISFPNLENQLTIRGGTFKNCMNLKEIELPYNITIFDEPFGVHTQLLNIKDINTPNITGTTILRWFYPGLEEYKPNGTETYIYENTFKGHETLTKVTITNNIRRIEDGAFSNCEKLKTIVAEERAPYIERRKLTGSDNIQEVFVPNLRYFLYSPGLKVLSAKIIIENDDLKHMMLDNEIDNKSFYFEDLISIQIPSNMKRVESETFEYHRKLKRVIIPENIKNIDYRAFADCYNLESVVIESDKTNINWAAFENSDNIKKIFIPNMNLLLKSGLYKTNARYIINKKEFVDYDVDQKIDSKESLKIFENIVEANTVNIYKLLKTKGVFNKLKFNTKAFVDVFKVAIQKDYVDIIEVVAKDGKIHKRRINEYIDYAKKVGANNSLIYLTKWKNEHINLETERKKELAKAKKLMSDPDAMLRETFNFRKNKNFGLGVSYKDKEELKIIQLIDFPDRYKGEDITYLPHGSLKNSSANEVILPKKLKFIGNETFYNCKNFKNIELPSDVNIGENSFNQCQSLEKLTIKNNRLGDVGMFAFSYATSLKELDVSGGLGDVEKYAFANAGIKRLVLPESSPRFGIGTFINCQNLEDVTLPNDIPQIQRRMFADCVSLKEIELPNSVKKILTQAFYGCENLEKIVIPSSVTQIGHDSFEGCDKLVIYVERGSDAHRTAVENNLDYEFI